MDAGKQVEDAPAEFAHDRCPPSATMEGAQMEVIPGAGSRPAQAARVPLSFSGSRREPLGLQERGRWTRRAFGTALPVLYVWFLPLLAEVNWAHKCPKYPNCEFTGLSVSMYISNAHATGAMAGVFFYPCLHMWSNAKEVANDRWVSWTLIVFQFAFGLFLSAPIVEFGAAHGLSVGTFCMASLFHFAAISRHCHSHRLWKCKILLAVSCAAFATVFSLVVISRFNQDVLGERVPWLFYTAECIGLSSQAIFPMLWFKDADFEPPADPTTAGRSSSLLEAGAIA